MLLLKDLLLFEYRLGTISSLGLRLEQLLVLLHLVIEYFQTSLQMHLKHLRRTLLCHRRRFEAGLGILIDWRQ
jgi:hypothetical protein